MVHIHCQRNTGVRRSRLVREERLPHPKRVTVVPVGGMLCVGCLFRSTLTGEGHLHCSGRSGLHCREEGDTVSAGYSSIITASEASMK